MKNIFICSIICDGGILGGGLYLDDKALTYKTNKLTVDAQYRNLVLPLAEIKEISWKRILFPIATVHMKHGGDYKFLLFNKARFEECFKDALAQG
jgi:hypothetical protein